MTPSPCTPAGPFPAPEHSPVRCADTACGATLTLTRMATRNDWTYLDGQGRAAVDHAPPALAADPTGWWAALARTHPAAYSALSARVELGQWSWVHRHRPGPAIAPRPVHVPWCCTQPMWSSPDGWVCRTTGTLAPYARA